MPRTLTEEEMFWARHAFAKAIIRFNEVRYPTFPLINGGDTQAARITYRASTISATFRYALLIPGSERVLRMTFGEFLESPLLPKVI